MHLRWQMNNKNKKNHFYNYLKYIFKNWAIVDCVALVSGYTAKGFSYI